MQQSSESSRPRSAKKQVCPNEQYVGICRSIETKGSEDSSLRESRVLHPHLPLKPFWKKPFYYEEKSQLEAFRRSSKSLSGKVKQPLVNSNEAHFKSTWQPEDTAHVTCECTPKRARLHGGFSRSIGISCGSQTLNMGLTCPPGQMVQSNRCILLSC